VRSSTLLIVAAALGLSAAIPALVTTAVADGRANRPDILPVSEVKKGMKGYGLTVFEGTKPERFEVEVIDVLQNFKPRQELILIKTKHPRLDVTKIVGGMSGSPIYLKGKMVGAYSYGWTFGVESVAGVTPIRSMLDDMERPLPEMLHGFPLRALPGKKPGRQALLSPTKGRFEGDLADYSLRGHAEQLRESRADLYGGGSRLTPVSTPLLLGGLTAESAELAREYLEPLGFSPLQAGGGGGGRSGSSSEATGYVDGGSLGVDLVSGDLSAMGLGTVTRVEGSKLVAFGHPMMNVGITSLPTTRARVLWFMASQMRSFKMGESVGALGALVNDRQSSIVVDETIVPPTVQVELSVRGEPGAPYEDWQFEVAHDRFMTPALLGIAFGNGLGTTAAERRHVTWTMKTEIEFEGYPAIEVLDFGSSPVGTPSSPQMMQSSAMEAIGEVLNNPWEMARVNRVSSKVELRFARDVARLVGVDLLTPEIDPGEKARVRLTMEPFAGERFTRVVSLDVPKQFAGESVTFSIEPGYAVEPFRPSPESLGELISNLEVPSERHRSLVFSYATGNGGAAHRGVVAENLPPFALDVLTSTTASNSPAQFASQHHQVIPTSLYIIGTDTFTVQVRKNRR
jgi:hypothetical protein